MSALRRAKVFRNVELPQQWLGLEPFDALGVITLGWLLMVVNRGAVGLNLLVVVLTYGAVRIGKRGKPEGFTRSVIRHYLRPPVFSAAAPDRQGAANPFPVTAVTQVAMVRQSATPGTSSPPVVGSPSAARRASHSKGEPS